MRFVPLMEEVKETQKHIGLQKMVGKQVFLRLKILKIPI